MKELVLVLVTPEFADWEPALLAAGLRGGFGMWEPRYNVKVVASTLDPVLSIGGFRVVPDYSFSTIPNEYAGLILVGGMSWFTSDIPAHTLPLIRKTLEKGKVLGAICDASMFLGVSGFLNIVHHTSNNLEVLKQRAGIAYTGETRYHADQKSVRDGNVITANGLGFIEFACDVLAALDVASDEVLGQFYATVKSGIFPVR